MFEPLKDYPMYGISREGEVVNFKTGHIKKHTIDHKGYPRVSLYVNNKQHYRLLHCLQCGAALTKKPKQAYAQWERQKYCDHVCAATGDHKKASTAKDRSNLHKFWRRRIPEPTVCELCREPRKLALSNRSQKYHNVITDWWYLCYQCHGRYDAVGKRVWDFRKEAYGQAGRA